MMNNRVGRYEGAQTTRWAHKLFYWVGPGASFFCFLKKSGEACGIVNEKPWGPQLTILRDR